MDKVPPLYKSGHRNMPENYKPISVFPGISKVIKVKKMIYLVNVNSASKIHSIVL
jgi:hypothetical protein